MTRSRLATDGLVQIGVLAGLVTVAGIVTFALSESRRTLDRASALDRVVLGSTDADSDIRRLLAAINDPADNLESAVGVTGRPFPFEPTGARVKLAIEGEAGKVNPLTIARRVLEQYVAEVSISAADRAQLLTLIAEARETGDATAAMNALHAYLMPALTIEVIMRDFSTLTALSGVDPQFASERVLRALPDISDAQAAEIVRQQSSTPGTITVQSAYFAIGRPLFTLVATVHWNERESFTRRVPIELTTSGRAVTLDGFR